jgi:hypothetical protein
MRGVEQEKSLGKEKLDVSFPVERLIPRVERGGEQGSTEFVPQHHPESGKLTPRPPRVYIHRQVAS